MYQPYAFSELVNDKASGVFFDRKALVLDNLEERKTRNVVIMYTKITEVKKKNGRFILVIGIDLFSQKIVRLIDNHGKSYGLCKYTNEFKDVKPETVIKVPCELSSEYVNTLRITNKFEILGVTNFGKLLEKMRRTNIQEGGPYPFEKISVPNFLYILLSNPEKEFYARVHMASTIKEYKGKHQIKISFKTINCFADILDNKFIEKNCDLSGKFVKARALAKGVFVDGKIRIYILKFYTPQLYQSKREHDKEGLSSLIGQYCPEDWIEMLLDEGYTPKSKAIPVPPYMQYMEEGNSEMNYDYQDEERFFSYYDPCEDEDQEVDYGYMEDEDYAE